MNIIIKRELLLYFKPQKEKKRYGFRNTKSCHPILLTIEGRPKLLALFFQGAGSRSFLVSFMGKNKEWICTLGNQPHTSELRPQKDSLLTWMPS